MNPDDPRHGKATGYNAGCRDACCAEAGRRKHKLYLLRRERMGGSTTVDTARAIEVILEAKQRMSYSAMARAINSSHNYITKIERGQVKRISPEREAAILGLRNYVPADSSHVSPVGAQRRLRALHALGYSCQRLSDETGYGLGLTKKLMSDNPWPVIEARNDKAIREAYDRLCMRVPTSDNMNERSGITRARNKAQRLGWSPPLAWDDIDRDEEPASKVARLSDHRGNDELDEAVVMRVMSGERLKMTVAERTEVVRRLRDRGVSYLEITQRTGIQKVERYREVAS